MVKVNQHIPSYDRFFSDKAIELVKWSLSEPDRLKSNNIFRVACRMEYRNRKYYGDGDGIRDRGGCWEKAEPLNLIHLKVLMSKV